MHDKTMHKFCRGDMGYIRKKGADDIEILCLGNFDDEEGEGESDKMGVNAFPCSLYN